MEAETAAVVEWGGGPPPSLEMVRSPESAIDEAIKASKALRQVVKAQGWLQKYGGGSEHLTIEAWQFIGRFYGVCAYVAETRYVEYGDANGFEAIAEVRTPDGRVLSRATGLCMTDEDHWRRRGSKAVSHRERLGMAQTRACSRALANLFRSVAKMAGYEGTPAEEAEYAAQQQAPTKPKQEPREAAAEEVERLTSEEIGKAWGLAKELYGDSAKDVFRVALDKLGCKASAQVPRAQYGEFLREIEGSL